jgi:hypothetical protein
MGLVVLASPATAAKSCERQVIDDWYDNGRVDRLYPTTCYRDAIKSLPTDVLDYSSAKNDILRALAYRQRGQADPGRGGASTTTTPTTPTPDPTTPDPTTPTGSEATTPAPTEPEPTTPDTLTDAAPAGESSSSVPVPLIVLGGLAVLLCAAGVAGYLTRRFRGGGEPPATP